MTISNSQRYGGSAQQAEDSLQWHRLCSQSGSFCIKRMSRSVVLSAEEDATERGFIALEQIGVYQTQKQEPA